MSSSDLYVLDASFFRHSTSSEMASYEPDQFFSEPFSPFSDIDILQAISDHQSNENPVENQSHHNNSLDQSSPTILSSSPPSYQLESLSLCQATHLNPLDQNCANLANGLPNFPAFDALEVKTEQCHLALDQNAYNNNQVFGPHSYSGAENVAKFMQRSFSSNSFDGKPGFVFQPCFDSLMESSTFQNQALSSPENSFLAGQMRRVSSTGDLQNFRTARNPRESSVMEEAAANFKMGRYSAEERKEKISKYRAKRSQRNFNKTIKYACRKTLADNRPRIRGRFARNDETGEVLKAACSSNREEDEDELWVEGLNVEEEENGTVRGGGGGGEFMNNFGATQFQYYGF
ncbi:putative zinc finger protein CONSTANS-LIKE 11 [Prunus avium]|uniref:Zinc finger protein CONSTANS-LIKE 11 n=1 Tax=Prunus avium TaxID=42229 RepID=A0A6P5SVJ1_PRUAV|nr:putative zinc finger protein CONSTANS-LIKE 11 [Prunus avium]